MLRLPASLLERIPAAVNDLNRVFHGFALDIGLQYIPAAQAQRVPDPVVVFLLFEESCRAACRAADVYSVGKARALQLLRG